MARVPTSDLFWRKKLTYNWVWPNPRMPVVNKGFIGRKYYTPWAPKTMKNRGFGHPETRFFTIKTSKNEGFGGPWHLIKCHCSGSSRQDCLIQTWSPVKGISRNLLQFTVVCSTQLHPLPLLGSMALSERIFSISSHRRNFELDHCHTLSNHLLVS